ncbi:MAG: hypothetical protein WCD20_18435 [Rhodomicrobium sp.]
MLKDGVGGVLNKFEDLSVAIAAGQSFELSLMVISNIIRNTFVILQPLFKLFPHESDEVLLRTPDTLVERLWLCSRCWDAFHRFYKL